MTYVLLFTRIVAWAMLVVNAALIAMVTVGQLLEHPATRLADDIRGHHWPPLSKPAARVFIAAAWLYATWGWTP